MPHYDLIYSVTLYTVDGLKQFAPVHRELSCEKEAFAAEVKRIGAELRQQHVVTRKYGRVVVSLATEESDDPDELVPTEEAATKFTSPREWVADSSSDTTQFPSAVPERRVVRAFAAIEKDFAAVAWGVTTSLVVDGKLEYEGVIAALEFHFPHEARCRFDGKDGVTNRPLAWALMRVYVDDLLHADHRAELAAMESEMSASEIQEGATLYESWAAEA